MPRLSVSATVGLGSQSRGMCHKIPRKCSRICVEFGWVDGWLDGWMDGWVDGWVGGWMDGWVGGWMDGSVGDQSGDDCAKLVVTWLREVWARDGLEHSNRTHNFQSSLIIKGRYIEIIVNISSWCYQVKFVVLHPTHIAHMSINYKTKYILCFECKQNGREEIGTEE